MKDFDLQGFLQSLREYELEFGPNVYVWIAVFLLLVVIYVVQKYWLKQKDRLADKATVIMPKDMVQTPVSKPAAKPAAVEPAVAPSMAETPAKPKAVEAKLSHIPQDSVLRRHFSAQIRYMLETLSLPLPTDSVLRRHYEHLISSQLDACLEDEAQYNKLLGRYDEHRRSAMA